MGGWWRWALVNLDGVAPSRMVSVSASVNLPLHHKVQNFSSGTGSLGWSRKKGCKTVVVVDSWNKQCGIPYLRGQSVDQNKTSCSARFSSLQPMPGVSFTALTLLVGREEELSDCKIIPPIIPKRFCFGELAKPGATLETKAG